MSKIILVVSAHSDDEALGCSGTIAKHSASGDEVHVLFMTDGVGSRHAEHNEVTDRYSAAQKSCEILRVTSMQQLDFPDNMMDAVPLLEVTQALEKVVSDIRPNVIYTHHPGDLNIDHQITHKAVITSCRPQPDSCVNQIYAFEVLSSTDWQSSEFKSFTPNVFVDITSSIETKRKVLEVYSEEMRDPPHSRSVENAIRLNALRGNSVGLDYAEAFELIRELKL